MVATVWLDANENPFTWPEHVLAQAWETLRAGGTHRYPRDGQALRRALAEYAGVPPEWVLPGNGSDELIIALLSSLGRRVGRVILPWPTFTFYRRVATALDLSVVLVGLDADFSLSAADLGRALRSEREALVVLCRPNNPTGNLFPRDVVLAALEWGAWVVVDEAYFEFSGETVCDLLARHRRLVVLRTLSKAFALAALRVGYALAHPDTLAVLRSLMQPYSVDAFSRAAALVALEHADLTREWVRALCACREELRRDLAEVPGLRPYPSRANFLLVEVLPEEGRGGTARQAGSGAACGPRGSGAGDRRPGAEVAAMLAAEGVRVRCWPEEPRLRDFFRVSVGLPRENAALVEALRRSLARGEAGGELTCGARG
ncbi:MAG: histidinol-phosphate transaminase [Bacillota bacterium]|nr:histidinol-phosphate transaminase [Bacillota bacterium]